MEHIQGYTRGFYDGIMLGGHIVCKRIGINKEKKRELLEGLVKLAYIYRGYEKPGEKEYMQTLVDHLCEKDGKDAEAERVKVYVEEDDWGEEKAAKMEIRENESDKNDAYSEENDKIEFTEEEYLKMFSIFSRHFFNEIIRNTVGYRSSYENARDKMLKSIDYCVQDFLVKKIPDEVIKKMIKIAETDVADILCAANEKLQLDPHNEELCACVDANTIKFLNPGNAGFRNAIKQEELYADKTGLLKYTNSVIGTPQKFICDSRPSCFGKTTNVNMMVAYYSRGCDSSEMFKEFDISNMGKLDLELYYRAHLNKHDVIHIDMELLTKMAGNLSRCVGFIQSAIIDELRSEFPDLIDMNITKLSSALSSAANKTGRKFIIIIDEWDYLIRNEDSNEEIQNKYLKFLADLFKPDAKYIDLVYITGILPLSGCWSIAPAELKHFTQFSMLDAKVLAPYFGFTDSDMEAYWWCNSIYKEDWRSFYGGFLLSGCRICNITDIKHSAFWNKYCNYWWHTSPHDMIVQIIKKDTIPGLKDTIDAMLHGSYVQIDISSYRNGVDNLKTKDDVLTMMIHYGYLAYNCDTSEAYIPNYEIRSELGKAVFGISDFDEEDGSDEQK